MNKRYRQKKKDWQSGEEMRAELAGSKKHMATNRSALPYGEIRQ